MQERAEAQARRNDAAFQESVRRAAGTGAGTTSTADELTKLADLRDRGALSADDYERAKNKVLAHDEPGASPAPARPDMPVRPST
jgi:Short C-terminal domain